MRVEMGEEQLSKLEHRLKRVDHLPLSSYRDGCIKRRLTSRIRNLGLHSLSQYLDLLDQDPVEAKKLIDALTVSVTSFFRDPETFALISKKIAPELLRHVKKNGTEARVWSAGCSTGEEAYSLAITFLEAAPEFAERRRLRIWATDIDEQAVARAEKGNYPKERLGNLKTAQIEKYFTKNPDGFQVRPELKALIDFRRENLLASGFSGFESMDLIMCRNLLIYLEKEVQNRVLGNFERSLRNNGYLILGKTEFMGEPYRSRFEHISPTERVYKKVGRELIADAGGIR